MQLDYSLLRNASGGLLVLDPRDGSVHSGPDLLTCGDDLGSWEDKARRVAQLYRVDVGDPCDASSPNHRTSPRTRLEYIGPV